MKSGIQKLKDEVKYGLNMDDAVTKLHQLGFTITKSMIFVREEYGVSLGEAKTKVASNDIWADLVKASDKMHEDLTKYLSEIDGVELVLKGNKR